MVIGILGAYFVKPPRRAAPDQRRKRIAVLSAMAIASLGLATVFIVWGRAFAVDRMLGSAEQEELRIKYLPLMIKMVKDFFPFGSGFGSFDPVFRSFEPLEVLSSTYFNNAHNDLVELALTGGLPALVVLGALLWWFGRTGTTAFSKARDVNTSRMLARASVVMISIMLLASLTDYPLRTPALGAVFAIACAWLAGYSSRGSPSADRLQGTVDAPIAFDARARAGAGKPR